MNKINLRKVFVQLLFSLAIGQVALRIGNLVIANATITQHYYSYLHLLLCVIIISTSWVGWYNSKSPHNSEIVSSVFSLQYIILLVDMFLVICYFIIVNGAEVSTNSIFDEIPQANSHIEVFWTMIIFLTYLFWDIISKLVKFEYTYDCANKKIYRKLVRTGGIFRERIWPTTVCCIFAVVAYFFMKDETRAPLVALIDIMLIALFITFRGFKEGVTKLYDIEKQQLSEETLKELETENCEVTFPAVAEDGKILHFTKYFCTKIMPPSIVIVSLLMYLIFN